MADTERYLALCENIKSQLKGKGASWLDTLRQKGLDHFSALGFPTTRDEQWRFTRVRPLLQHDFELETQYRANGMDAARLANISFGDAGCRRLVFVNGNFAPNLSEPGRLEGDLWIGSLRDALQRFPDRLEACLGRNADPTAGNAFVALNTALLLDGAFIHIPNDVRIEEPIHLVFVSARHNGLPTSQPRNVVIAGSRSRAIIVESYVGDTDEVYFTNAVSELILRREADLTHYRVQKESRRAYHVGTLQASMEEASHFETLSVSMGGTLVRNDINTVLSGEGIRSTMDGLYLAAGRQHVDNHTQIDHAMPNCNSYEVFKGILNDRATAVFNGKIHVHPDAQKTDAKQSNGCMLLSDDARINTNPQLEIYADDVKCTHGAVVGQIEEDAVFYLRSRGISKQEARHTLVYAFASELLEKIRVAALRDRLEKDLFDWLNSADRRSTETLS